MDRGNTLPPAPAAPGSSPRVRRQLLFLDDVAPIARTLRGDERLLIGRGEEADVCLHDPSVSRRHATICCEGPETVLVDLGSHNGTRVNGVRVDGRRTLAAGDILLLGAVAVVYQCVAFDDTARPLLDGSQLRTRVAEEVERALRYKRPFTLVAVPLEGGSALAPELAPLVDARIRLSDSAALDGNTLWLLLTETAGPDARVPAERIVRALSSLAPRARAGYASCPDDAMDVPGLLARAAVAASAAAEEPVTAAATIATVDVAGQRVVVADPAMTRVYELVRNLAGSDLPVLILGETGVGKELAAMALHAWSRRNARPLMALNCAAIPETLLESELFGHEKGAFSGAAAAKPGKIELADGGTLFLDEVGEMSAACQAKLLRVLESRRVGRLGAVAEREVDVRLVAATNRALEAEVEAGRFRRDLYFRLSTASVYLPPLRERKRELPLLAAALLDDSCRRQGRAPKTLTPTALQALVAQRWPGNVRELKNLVDFVVATVDATAIGPEHVFARTATPGAPPATEFPNIYDKIRELEIEWMRRALDASGGVQARAAELIGMPLRTFVTKLKEYRIVVERRARLRGLP